MFPSPEEPPVAAQLLQDIVFAILVLMPLQEPVSSGFGSNSAALVL